jgi:hypothetical protein
VEPVLAAVRLSAIAVSMAIGTALVIMTVTRQTQRMTSHGGK